MKVRPAQAGPSSFSERLLKLFHNFVPQIPKTLVNPGTNLQNYEFD